MSWRQANVGATILFSFHYHFCSAQPQTNVMQFVEENFKGFLGGGPGESLGGCLGGGLDGVLEADMENVNFLHEQHFSIL